MARPIEYTVGLAGLLRGGASWRRTRVGPTICNSLIIYSVSNPQFEVIEPRVGTYIPAISNDLRVSPSGIHAERRTGRSRVTGTQRTAPPAGDRQKAACKCIACAAPEVSLVTSHLVEMLIWVA